MPLFCPQRLISQEGSEQYVRVATSGKAGLGEVAVTFSSFLSFLFCCQQFVVFFCGKVNDFVVSGFITEAQAKKGWLTRIVNYVANGHLDIGADNGNSSVFPSFLLQIKNIFLAANVLVQDRETGELLDEKMSTMIRLGIRSVYKNKLSSVRKGLDTKMVRAFLLNMTLRQGKKYNDPKSKDSIKRERRNSLLLCPT